MEEYRKMLLYEQEVIVLDIDSTDDLNDGQQQLFLLHGYYDHTYVSSIGEP